MSRRQLTGEVLLWLALLGIGILTGANVYQRIAIIPDWTSNLPGSLIKYFQGTTQAQDVRRFWDSAVPAATLLMIAAFALNLPDRARRKWLALAAILYFGALAVTLLWFVPRGVIPLFVRAGAGMSPEAVTHLAEAWIFWDWFRLAALFGTFLSLLKALTIRAD